MNRRRARAALWAAAWLCGCRHERTEPPTGVEAGPAATAAAQPHAERRAESWELAAHLDSCEIEHRGLSLDLGTPAPDVRRAFAIGPFDDVAALDRQGATVARFKNATVSYDLWLEEPLQGASVSLRALSGAARSVSVELDHKALGSARLPRDELSVVELPASHLELAKGRHRLSLRFSGRQRGSSEWLAEVDWLRIGAPDELDATYSAPTLRDIVTDVTIDGVPRRSIALHAPSAVRCPLRVPRDAELRVALGFWGAGRGVAELRLLVDGETPVTLQQRKVTGGSGTTWTPLALDLSPHAGKIARIELRVLETSRGGRVAFGDASVSRQRPVEGSVPEARHVVIVIAAALDRRRTPPWGPMGGQTVLGSLAQLSTAFLGYRVATSVPAAALASLLTGLPPRAHTLEDPAAKLPAGVATLATIAREGGTRAAMFTGVPTSFAAFGFGVGWDRFEALSPVLDLPATEPYERATEWLSAELAKPEPARQLVVVHVRGAHPPWDVTREEAVQLAPEEYSGPIDARRGGIVLGKLRARRKAAQRRLDDIDWKRLHALEDAALLKQDAALGQLIAALKKANAWDDTLFIYAGDVAVGDPSRLPYDPVGTLREDLLLVPLLVKFPHQALAGRGITSPVTSIDVAQTVLGALRLAPPARLAGMDLFQVGSGIDSLLGTPLVATLGNAYSTRIGSWLLSGELGSVPHLCAVETDPACVSDVLDAAPIAGSAIWSWTYGAELAATTPPLRSASREPASIDADTAAALTVWGDAQ